MKKSKLIYLLTHYSLRENIKRVLYRLAKFVFAKNIKQTIELNYLNLADFVDYRLLTEAITHSVESSSKDFLQLSHTFEPRYLISVKNAIVDTKTGMVFLGDKKSGFRLLEFSSEWPKESLTGNIVLPRDSQIQTVEIASLGLPNINYFHLLTHWLGNTMELERLANPILITPYSHSLSREIFALNDLRFVEATSRWIKVKSLSMINTTRLGYLHPEDRSLISKKLAGKQSKVEDIYVSRRRSSRALPKEDIIEKNLAKMGFKVVYSEELDLRSQIDLFSKARTILAPHGAGIANGLFAQAGTRVVEIMPSFRFNRCYEWQSSICNHLYSRVVYEGNSSHESLIQDILNEVANNG
jgi:hypothetical protein